MATRTRAPTVRPIFNHIGGEWVVSSGTRSLPVEDPVTGEVLRHVPLSTAADVDSAVGAAQNAFPGWRETSMVIRTAAIDVGTNSIVEGAVQ